MPNDASTDLSSLPTYVQEIQEIGAVGQILETVAAQTGLGFVAVAHVTDHSGPPARSSTNSASA